MAAHDLIRDQVIRTPVLNDPDLDEALGCNLFLKCENLQRTGAFKFRGASHAVAALRQQGVEGDIATESSGNHGAALSLASTLDGRRAHVVMPENSVPAKIASVRRYGGIVHFCEPHHRARYEGLSKLVDDGLLPIPPYDDNRIIAGQGTVALEMIEQVEGIDTIIAPIGGGGLIGGVSIVAAENDIEVIGAEPEGASDTYESFRSGTKADDVQADTIADGLRALIGHRNFALIRQNVSEVLLVSDEEIIEAMALVWRSIRIPIEPSSATVIAAMSRYRDHFRGCRVCAIISGGNIDPRFWAETIIQGSDAD
jgi:threonine dehydratase